ncbi:hypothetical protein ATCC90586_006632 [Pythium insidiosum]|nr:hypothetical protein ATCC90586_006632 [Pythium insidiosum]
MVLQSFLLSESGVLVAAGVLVVATAIVPLAWLLLRSKDEPRYYTDVPAGTRPIRQLNSTLPLIGNTIELLRNAHRMHEWTYECCKDLHGDPALVKSLGRPDLLVLTTVEAFEECFKNKFDNFPKGEFFCGNLRDVLGHGIFAVDHAQWVHQRKTASNLFTARSIRDSMTETVRRHVLTLHEILERAARAGTTVDLFKLMNRFTIETFSEIGFGIRMNCLDAEEEHPFQTAFDRAQRALVLRFVRPQWFWKLQRILGIGFEGQLRSDLKAINDTVYGIIAKSLERRQRNEKLDNKDIVSLFLDNFDSLPENQGQEFDPTYLRDIVINFLIAGRDTTAQALSWFFRAVSEKPDVVHKIRAEINQVLPELLRSPTPIAPTLEQVQQLTYLEAALKETLRLYPSVPFNSKDVEEDVVLSDGTFVRKGWNVALPSYVLGRLEHVWGKDACEFKPERWIDESTGKLVHVPASKFIAFNAGPRLCLGMNLAMMEMKIVVASLVSKLDIHVIQPDQAEYELLYSTQKGEAVRVKQLLESGVDVDTRDAEVHYASGAFPSPRGESADFGMSAPKEYMTALQCAASRGHLDVVRLLLDYGADIHAKDSIGATALYKAASSGCIDVVRLLIERGADVHTRHQMGRTPLVLLFENKVIFAMRDLVNEWKSSNASWSDNMEIPEEAFKLGSHSAAGANGLTDKHDVTFWDFAGQDVYHAAHSLGERHRQAEPRIKAFVEERILYWLQLIYSRLPEAFFVMGTLHELGDVIWYANHDCPYPALHVQAILSPQMVLDFVREVISHELLDVASSGCSTPTTDPTRLRRHEAFKEIQQCKEWGRWMQQLRTGGRIDHSLLTHLPMWKELANADREDQALDNGSKTSRLLVVKSLLQDFSLAYPDGDREWMAVKSNLVVPAYWKMQESESSEIDRHESNLVVPAYWKMQESESSEIDRHEFGFPGLPSALFEHIVVRSFHPDLQQIETTPTCVASVVKGESLLRIQSIVEASRVRRIDDWSQVSLRLPQSVDAKSVFELSVTITQSSVLWPSSCFRQRVLTSEPVVLTSNESSSQQHLPLELWDEAERAVGNLESAIAAALAVPLAWQLYSRWACACEPKKEPGVRLPHELPTTRRWLGDTLELVARMPDLHDWMAELCLQYRGEPYVFHSLGRPDMIVIYTPQTIEDVLKNEFDAFPKGPFMCDNLRDVLGEGIFATDGEQWQRQRKIASHLFTLRAMRDIMATCIRKNTAPLCAVLRDASEAKTAIDMHRLFTGFTMQTFAEIGFGVDLNCLDATRADPLQRALDSVLEIIVLRFMRPTWVWKLQRWLNVGAEAQMRRDIATLDAAVTRIIHETLRRRAEQQKRVQPQEEEDASTHRVKSASKDIVSLFLENRLDDDAEVDEAATAKYLRDTVLNFLVAGRDSTAQTLSWFLWCLSRNANVEQKIRDELASALPELMSGELSSPSMEQVQRLTYLEAAIRETLRLHPPVPINTKHVMRDVVLSDGTLLRKGATVSLAYYAMGRMPFIWGPDATEYKPERWLDAATGRLVNVSAFQFVSFHAGPRMCLGVNLAMMELKIVLATLLSRFRFEMVPGQTITYVNSVTLPIKGALLVNIKTIAPEERP